MSRIYRDHLGRQGVIAGWMQIGNGGLYHQTLGFAFDSFMAEDARRMLASLPGYATPASLREIGRDRNVLLLPEMTQAAQIECAGDWIPAHQDHGLAIGMARQVQYLFEPERPTVRIVWGNSTRANWATFYGTDDVSAIDVGRGAPEGDFWAVRNDPSNFDWFSEYYDQPEVSDDEPTRLNSCWAIVYKPDSVELLEDDTPDDPETTSAGSTLTVRASLNIALMAKHWAGAHARLAGWILAGDHESFDPANDNTGVPGGYPDGRWWQDVDEFGDFIRLQTARYYFIKPPPGVG